jgi:hypothetical protein
MMDGISKSGVGGYNKCMLEQNHWRRRRDSPSSRNWLDSLDGECDYDSFDIQFHVPGQSSSRMGRCWSNILMLGTPFD